MISWLQIRLPKKRLASMVFCVIFACCACQASPTPLPSATAVPPTATPTQTLLPPTATRALTSTQRPHPTATPTPEPFATAEEAGLSPDGPWLVLPNIEIDGLGFQHMGVVLVNQDGSGYANLAVIPCWGTAHEAIIEHPENVLVTIGWETFLINPQLKKAWSVYKPIHPCTAYTGAEQNLLAGVFGGFENGYAELRVYRLPEGKLLNSFPLMKCSEPLNTWCENSLAWEPHVWDPAGQKLAFPVIIDSGTALYVYNVGNGAAQEVARVQGAITNIWWSPDGSNLVLGVGHLLNQPFVESVQTVPLAGGSPRELYTPEYLGRPHEIITWIDNHRFLACEGSLRDVVMEGAENLWMGDVWSGQAALLFDDGFVDLDLDPKTETVVVAAAVYASEVEWGYYLIPIVDPKPTYIGEPMSYEVDWDADQGLFVTGALCPDDPAQILAFDPQGTIACLPPEPESNPLLPPTQSPDGKWSVTLEDGLWIEGPGQPRVKVLEETPENIIWRPDSGGLFAVTNQGLEYISLPDRIVRSIVLQSRPYAPYGSGIAYQWIEN